MIPPKTIPGIISTLKQRGDQERLRWDKWFAWYHAESQTLPMELDRPTPAGDEEIVLETNFPFQFVDTMCANICPTNPQMTVRALDPDKKPAARAREALLNKYYRQDNIKKKARRIAAITAMTGRGFSKTVWNSRKRRVCTSIIDPRFFFYDLSADDWEDITYCFEAVPIRKDDFQARVASGRYDPLVASRVTPTGFPEWMRSRWDISSENQLPLASRELFEWVIVYDFYDFTAGRFYQWVDGVDTAPLFVGELPYPLAPNPYRMLRFNDNIRWLDGISDIRLIEQALERMNELDTLELEFAHSCIPTAQVNKNAFEKPEEAKSMFSASTRPGDVAWYSLKDDRRIADAVSYSTVPSLSPSFDRMRSRSESVIQRTLGMADYMRGGLGKAEVATELALSDEATRTRNGWRGEELQDWILGVSKIALGIMKHNLDPKRTMHIVPAGELDSVEVNRATLAFPEPGLDGKLPAQDFDDDFYECEMIPYSPADDNRQARLQLMAQYFAILVQLPTVDKVKLTSELLDMLKLSDAIVDPSAQQPTMAVQGQPGAPGMSGTPGSAPGVVPSGTSPETEAVLPPDVRTGGGASPPIPRL